MTLPALILALLRLALSVAIWLADIAADPWGEGRVIWDLEVDGRRA